MTASFRSASRIYLHYNPVVHGAVDVFASGCHEPWGHFERGLPEPAVTLTICPRQQGLKCAGFHMPDCPAVGDSKFILVISVTHADTLLIPRPTGHYVSCEDLNLTPRTRFRQRQKIKPGAS